MLATFLRPSLTATALAAAAAVCLTACNVRLSTDAEARDQWQRHYALAQGGTLEIRNTNGVIQVEPVDGDSVDITADRVVRAATDQAAKDALAAFDIKETVAPDHITIDSATRGGVNLTFNLSRRVEYRVRMPRWAHVRLETTNGDITVAGARLTGRFRAETTNGRIRATGLEGAAAASTTNGEIALEISKLSDEGVTCDTTNGRIGLVIPPDVHARLSARVTNGAIRTEGLALSVSEQSRRRLDASLGGGGPMIKLETTNGAIEVRVAK